MLTNLVSVLTDATLTLPAIEISILLASLSCCLVFRFTRTGLLIAYLFIYRWGWILFLNSAQTLMVAYLVFGMLIGIATVVGMLRAPSDH